MEEYEAAMVEAEMPYSSRLTRLNRAARLQRKHAEQGLEYLNDSVVAEFNQELNDKFYNGGCCKRNYQLTDLSVQRFLRFVDCGDLKTPNKLKGCWTEINGEFHLISEQFIATIPHPNTRNDARWVVHKYFAWLEKNGKNDLGEVEASQIREYLLFASKQYSQNSMRIVKLYMSKLYEFLYAEGLSESNYNMLLSFKICHVVKIKKAMPREDISKLLEVIDRRNIKGKRAYAAMMLGAVLGLRACDVAELKLRDIDWMRGELRILQSKTEKSLALPLTRDVGEALQDYILHGRFHSKSKQVFVSLNAPHDGLKSAVQVGEIFQNCCRKAGLPISKQFHQLRRSLATSMVDASVSIYDVAQVLGDSNINSTKQYISVDMPHLKLCALSFDGIAPKGGADR
jgi:site-specific recombinase XerD